MEVHAPCPPGWGFPNKELIKIGKMAVECGIHVLFEIKDGVFRLTSRSRVIADKGKKKSVEGYLRKQARFRKMTEAQVEKLQALIDAKWDECLRRHKAA
jgi:pyruvate ferredoxin oxidoreductase beta subunit